MFARQQIARRQPDAAIDRSTSATHSLHSIFQNKYTTRRQSHQISKRLLKIQVPV